jgi:isobutyryl-CoA mutase
MSLYRPKNPVRIVTAASLFDGHDASINLMRRLLQEAGCEVIHLGHNRSVSDVATAVLQESAQGVCISSYQGGHMEYFKYLKDSLKDQGAGFVKIFGGGGGVIIHEEKRELEAYGIDQIFHPDDGRRLGLEGMISMIVETCDYDYHQRAVEFVPAFQSAPKGGTKIGAKVGMSHPSTIPHLQLGLWLTQIENKSNPQALKQNLIGEFYQESGSPIVLGITGTGGAGKSSLIDELVQRILNAYPKKNIGILCVDPSKRKTGGSLLGDRIRMNSLSRPGTFMRSVASRGSGREISGSLPDLVAACRKTKFDLIIAETSGIGQGNTAITEFSDLSLYVMTAEYGAPSQLEKIDMIDFANFVAINKADRRGSKDAERDVAKQYRRSRKLPFDAAVPVFLTQAAQFNDEGVNQLFFAMVDEFSKKDPSWTLSENYKKNLASMHERVLIPPDRQSYLAEITHSVREYKTQTQIHAERLSLLGALEKLKTEMPEAINKTLDKNASVQSASALNGMEYALPLLKSYDDLAKDYEGDELVFSVRGKEIRQPLVKKSLSGSKIPRVVVPKLTDWGDRYRYMRLENVPGNFPYTAGVYPLRRNDEEPKRMFAGEGGPVRTNRRFHFLCKGEKAHRLSTAFDSVTLYGHDPDLRPDIFGKVGESGVSISSLDDMKKLYAGFDLCDPNTSVSMTINGPAPMILAFYFNTAIDQQVEKQEKVLGRKLTPQEQENIASETLQKVRGTVQADILKEDQGQNTCIFSINFAMQMMGDIQEYFIQKKIRNFYSVSISGYHIAEAGANPISQLAFTLSNGFTILEYYRARGLNVDDFAPNLSFFFSNGLDPEYTVMGRVARRIWAIALRDLYGANARSQMLKYHIQTSGRSLHAQEITFNDIRTTLQALVALSDNCNSLHTNAFDEAITTPTEASVRQAMAIQLIINREFGTMMNENPNQGSYFFEKMTDLVEEAVLDEFMRINERGGVLGAMETQYQRAKIQEESYLYEHMKHSGELPIVGVNTFIDPNSDQKPPMKIELARASYDEKKAQLSDVTGFKDKNRLAAAAALEDLRLTALQGKNIFASLMKAARVCSLFEMTQTLYELGGQYRRNV